MKIHYVIAIVCYCALIFWLSNRPVPPMPTMRFPHEDKLAHLVVYGGLGGLVSLGLHRSERRWPSWVLGFAPVLFVFLYGLSDEVHQYFIPERSFSLADLAADVAGALLVHGVCRLFFTRYPALMLARVGET